MRVGYFLNQKSFDLSNIILLEYSIIITNNIWKLIFDPT